MELREGERQEPVPRKRGRKPGQRRRTPLEVARDRKLIGRLRLRYALWTQEDIAAEVNKAYETPEELAAAEEGGYKPAHVSARQVGEEIKTLTARLEAEATEDTQALRRMRIAELRELEEFCRERYDATVGTHTIVRETEGGDRDGAKQTTTEELAGESGYLTLALQCKKQIIELEGITPPKKTALTNPDGTKPFDAFGDSEELKRLAALFGEIVSKPGGKT